MPGLFSQQLTRFTGMVLLVFSPLGVYAEAKYDTPGPLPSTKIIAPQLMGGNGFRITETAYADGMLCSFSLWTTQGWYRPQSLAMLEVRIREAHAMMALNSMRDDPLFLEGLTDQAGDTINATRQALRQPIQTIRNIPLGLEKVGSEIQSRANTGQVAGEDGKLRYSRVKRELAFDLGVDPYSSNEQLQAMLNTVASSRNAGALTGRVATALVGGGTGTALQIAQLNKNLQSRLRDSSAPQLQKENAAELRRLGCSDADIDKFLTGKNYTVTRCTAITESLSKLAGLQGISEYISSLGPASAPEVPLYHQIQSAMAAGFHRKKLPLTRVSVVSGMTLFTDSEGGVNLFAPVDYLMWTPLIEERIAELGDDKKLQVWISGTATPLAKEQLAKTNITLHEKAGPALLFGQ